MTPSNMEIAERLVEQIRLTKRVTMEDCVDRAVEIFAAALAAKDAERAEKLNTVRLTYGLLWHVHTDDKIVHQARRVLLNWLNDKDQQKIGIEEAKAILAKIGAGK